MGPPMSNAPDHTPPFSIKAIAAHCNSYKGAESWRSLFQLGSTLLLFTMTCGLMLYSLHISYWLTLFFGIPAAGLMTRIFIFQHDCGHGSFFKSKRANNWTGRALSILTAVPYDFWRRSHNLHHATSGNLDRCGTGDIDTITIRQYLALSKQKQWFYRIYRNPLFLLMLGTPVYLLILQRIPGEKAAYFHEDRKTLSPDSTWKSIMFTNIALLVFYSMLSFLIGVGTLLAIAAPILIISAWIGGWGFFIQHQFEDTYWETHDNWNSQEAALFGSSYYALPKVLQWFTGNIGLHHIHHLCSQIPNYKLQKCMDDRPELKEINKITLRKSLNSISLKLWDEDQNKLVSFENIKSTA